MSHLRERTEKICLNCNAQLHGKFCHICGQENTEPKESVWHLLNHFFQDITHFDGKFFSTLWLLVTRPGFLSAEYTRGRRASYLNPVRMYIFTSAFFFLLFFTFFKTTKETLTANSTINGKTLKQIGNMDSAAFAAFTSNINMQDGKAALPMTREEFHRYYDSAVNGALRKGANNLKFTPTLYRSKAEYDSLLKTGSVNDNWIERKLNYKGLEMQEKYHGDNQEAFKDLLEIFFHKLPQLLFVSLPVLAFLLMLLYKRHKEFYYVSHGIFSLHLYIFVFIVMLVSLFVGKINNNLDWGLLTFVRVLLFLTVFVYLFIAMRRFYRQGRMKTGLKFILLNLVFMIVMGLLFLAFMFLSFFSV